MRIKRISKVIIFCVILVLFLNYIYKILSWKDTAGAYYSSMNSFYDLEEDLVDVLFLGSSHCYCSVTNALLWDEHGIGSFNLAISGQDLASSYYCMVEALKTQNPEVICVEMYGTTFHGYLVEGNLYRNTLPYRMSVNAYNVVKNIVSEEKQKDILLRWPIIHTRYAELQKEDFVESRVPYIGYQPEFRVGYVEELNPYNGEEALPIEAEEEKWLRKIIALAEEADIQLCFFVAPYVLNENLHKNYNYVEQIAKENDVPFINMADMQEELGLDLSQDFIDWAHTNYYGAAKVTGFLGRFLKSNYDLPDRRGDERYALWDENSRVNARKFLNQRLSETWDINEYFDMIDDAEDYTIVVATSGNYYNQEVNLYEYMTKLGIGDEFYTSDGMWVMDNREIVGKSNGEDYFMFMELEAGDLAVNSTNGIKNIVIDKQSYYKVLNGINVVIYDNVLGEVIDVVGFDAVNQYACIR